jgi:hypothetical protein
MAVTYRYTTLAIFLAGLIVCLALVPLGDPARGVLPVNVPSDLINITLDMPQGTPGRPRTTTPGASRTPPGP